MAKKSNLFSLLHFGSKNSGHRDAQRREHLQNVSPPSDVEQQHVEVDAHDVDTDEQSSSTPEPAQLRVAVLNRTPSTPPGSPPQLLEAGEEQDVMLVPEKCDIDVVRPGSSCRKTTATDKKGGVNSKSDQVGSSSPLGTDHVARCGTMKQGQALGPGEGRGLELQAANFANHEGGACNTKHENDHGAGTLAGGNDPGITSSRSQPREKNSSGAKMTSAPRRPKSFAQVFQEHALTTNWNNSTTSSSSSACYFDSALHQVQLLTTMDSKNEEQNLLASGSSSCAMEQGEGGAGPRRRTDRGCVSEEQASIEEKTETSTSKGTAVDQHARRFAVVHHQVSDDVEGRRERTKIPLENGPSTGHQRTRPQQGETHAPRDISICSPSDDPTGAVVAARRRRRSGSSCSKQSRDQPEGRGGCGGHGGQREETTPTPPVKDYKFLAEESRTGASNSKSSSNIAADGAERSQQVSETCVRLELDQCRQKCRSMQEALLTAIQADENRDAHFAALSTEWDRRKRDIDAWLAAQGIEVFVPEAEPISPETARRREAIASSSNFREDVEKIEMGSSKRAALGKMSQRGKHGGLLNTFDEIVGLAARSISRGNAITDELGPSSSSSTSATRDHGLPGCGTTTVAASYAVGSCSRTSSTARSTTSKLLEFKCPVFQTKPIPVGIPETPKFPTRPMPVRTPGFTLVLPTGAVSTVAAIATSDDLLLRSQPAHQVGEPTTGFSCTRSVSAGEAAAATSREGAQALAKKNHSSEVATPSGAGVFSKGYYAPHLHREQRHYLHQDPDHYEDLHVSPGRRAHLFQQEDVSRATGSQSRSGQPDKVDLEGGAPMSRITVEQVQEQDQKATNRNKKLNDAAPVRKPPALPRQRTAAAPGSKLHNDAASAAPTGAAVARLMSSTLPSRGQLEPNLPFMPSASTAEQSPSPFHCLSPIYQTDDNRGFAPCWQSLLL
ncbi:unnamed protein product [Amoebophrya sp. A120]|nr:unnamed protein product [Amoebophrya sp. A120]|eukprot:GSA120T00015157001.1